ncbi:MAG: nicotinate-nucleotide--dimethylbenzimidazole phosphoribosyltransferase, partial [Enterocloster aldenensis]
MNLEEMVKSVKEADGTAVKQALRRWDQVAKPLNSLGVLEEDIVRIAGASGTAAVDIGKKAIVVMCADNGIVEEGVTQTGQEVTAIVAGNMAKGCSCVCIMARKAGADVIPIDVGIAGHDSIPGLLPRKVAGGTRNFLKGPSMSRGQALKAMETGIRTAFELKEKGYGLAGSGEMGIGNTTSS